jgi:hypothetical protein
MSPQERLLKQQQLQEQQKQAATATSRQRQPSSPGGDMEAQSEDDDLVDFLEGQMMVSHIEIHSDVENARFRYWGVIIS